MTRTANRIPAAPANTPSCTDDNPLTLAEVNADEWIAYRVREQGAYIRAEAAETGEVWFSGRGYHNNPRTIRNRDFALRVLVAHGELVQDPADRRRYIAI